MNSAKKVMNQQKDNSEKKENVTVKAATGKKKLGKFRQKCQGNRIECHMYSFGTCIMYRCWHTAVRS